jgi:hypothetical protein
MWFAFFCFITRIVGGALAVIVYSPVYYLTGQP